MNQILAATIIVLSIMASGAYAVSLVSDMSLASTASSDIDQNKKSENINAVYDGSEIIVKNTNSKDSEIVMFQFFDSSGKEVKRVTSQQRAFDGFANNALSVSRFDSSKDILQKHTANSFLPSELGVSSFDGLTGKIVTKYGNVFEIKMDNLASGMGGNATGDGKAMINGMGLQSRIIQKEYSGYVTHGAGMIGVEKSLKPYTPVSDTDDFASLVQNTDTKLAYPIPSFWKSYTYNGNSLVDTTASPNILGYSASKNIIGTNTVTTDTNGIHVVGTGTTILKLNNMVGENLLITGDVNGKVKLVKSMYDLTILPYNPDGFEIYSSALSKPNTSTVYGSCYYSSTWFYCSAGPASSPVPFSITGLNIKAGEKKLVTAKYESTYSGYYLYAVYCSSKYGGYSYWQVGCAHYTSGSTADPLSVGYSTFDPISKYHTISSLSGSTASHYSYTGNVKVYDKEPYEIIFEYLGSFNQGNLFGNEHYYLIVESTSQVDIKGETVTAKPFITISDLPANIPYKILKDGIPVIAGMTSPSGMIQSATSTNPLAMGGVINLYPDSLKYRGPFSTVIFDEVNSQTIHIDTVEDKVYVVHAYAKIPVIGNVNVTGTNLDGTLPLSYLDKIYSNGQDIMVPVIPGFHTINITINGIDTSLQYEDILGGTGIKIANPATSTVSASFVSSPISSAEAIAGTVTFAIATTNGNLNAIITQTASGNVNISNKYTLQQLPPLPPPPVRRDPLSGWVDVYVNGALVQQKTLGINPFPDFVPTATMSSKIVTKTVTYTYPDYVLSGTVSVPVNPGDFVEFFVYAKIFGEIDSYSAPSGYVIASSSGTSSATANIKDAHVQTSM